MATHQCASIEHCAKTAKQCQDKIGKTVVWLNPTVSGDIPRD